MRDNRIELGRNIVRISCNERLVYAQRSFERQRARTGTRSMIETTCTRDSPEPLLDRRLQPRRFFSILLVP